MRQIPIHLIQEILRHIFPTFSFTMGRKQQILDLLLRKFLNKY